MTFALIALCLVQKLKKQRLKIVSEAEWPYSAAKPLSHVEQIMYFRLVEALPECIVLAQVSMQQVLDVRKSANVIAWRNRISQKSLDFLICLKDSTIVAAIELDDKTHSQRARQFADNTKEKALTAAGIKLIRWQASAIPSVDVIRNTFTQ